MKHTVVKASDIADHPTHRWIDPNEQVAAARYGEHSVYGALVRAKREGKLTDELRKQIINTRSNLEHPPTTGEL